MSNQVSSRSRTVQPSDRARQRGAERRAAERRNTSGLSATLRLNGTSQQIEIMDISATGIQAESNVSAHSGQPVEIELPNIGIVRAVVRWGVGPYLGIEFDQPIDVEAVNAR